jgi:DNA-formamidopyrimidine glycosylase
MPELPEVETTRRGLLPHVAGRHVDHVLLRRPDLRWPIPREVENLLPGQRIDAIRRRAKYLLLDTEAGSALLHLGMSGSLRVLPSDTPVRAHDHVDIALVCADGMPDRVLRFNDPRRFGCLLWQAPGDVHPLLAGLGPEPLVRRLRWRLPVRPQPRPQRAGEDLPDGPGGGGRGGQHLRRGSAVHCRDLAAARRPARSPARATSRLPRR